MEDLHVDSSSYFIWITAFYFQGSVSNLEADPSSCEQVEVMEPFMQFVLDLLPTCTA